MEFLPYLLHKYGFKMDQFKLIQTQEDCTKFQRKKHFRNGKPNLYFKPLESIWDLYGDLDGRNIVIINDSMGKHSFNGTRNYIITK